jgi:hypothetical protein
LSAPPHRLPIRRRERDAEFAARLGSADVQVLAGLVRDLSALPVVNLRLGEWSGEILGRARRLVVAEWALAGDLDPDGVEAEMNAALSQSARLAGLS